MGILAKRNANQPKSTFQDWIICHGKYCIAQTFQILLEVFEEVDLMR
mgnify:FL=1